MVKEYIKIERKRFNRMISRLERVNRLIGMAYACMIAVIIQLLIIFINI